MHVFTVQSATLTPRPCAADKNEAFMRGSCQSAGLSPAHFLSLESTVCRPSRYSLPGFRFSIAWLSRRDGDLPFQTHFKGNVRWYSCGHILILCLSLEGETQIKSLSQRCVWPTLGFLGWIKCLFLTYHVAFCHGDQETNHSKTLFIVGVFHSGTKRR